jgi:hypothetical protein
MTSTAALAKEQEYAYLTFNEVLDIVEGGPALYSTLRCYWHDGEKYVEDKSLMLDLSYLWDIEEMRSNIKWHILFNAGPVTCYVLEF